MRPEAEYPRIHSLGENAANLSAIEIDFVGANDAHRSLYSGGIGIAHGRPEECPRRRLPRGTLI